MAFSPEEIRSLTPEGRAELARLLVELGASDAPLPRTTQRRRQLFVVLAFGCAAVLLAWIVVLARTLSPNQLSGHWRLAWVGLDVFELTGFLVSAWAALRARQLLIPAALVTGTLLLCDAWFDVVLSWDGPDRWTSVLSAALVEVPLGLLLWLVARRLVVLTLLVARSRLGFRGPVPPLRRARLLSPIGAPATSDPTAPR